VSFRKVRNTSGLAWWAFGQINGHIETARFHLARVPFAELEPVVRAIFDAGRRRGRAELALELGARLGLDQELGDVVPMPELVVAAVASASSAPRYITRERAEAVVIPVADSRTRRLRKP
jgi:hypothetical protein